MAEQIPRAEPATFDRCAGHLALDFANSVDGRHTASPVDRIPSYTELLAFARQCELASPAQLRRLEKRAALDPAAARAARREAVDLREALYRMFAAVVDSSPIAADDLAVVNRALARMRLSPHFEWEWAAGPDALDSPLGPIVRAALSLLTSGEQRERVRICAANDCTWLFLDTSKNRSRRWYDMKQCGNRNKVRRFYQRQN